MNDPRLALRLFHRMGRRLPAERRDMQLVGLRPNLRWNRIRRSRPRPPGRLVERSGEDGARALLGLVVFLNGGFERGELEFVDSGTIVVPVPGRAVLFPLQETLRFRAPRGADAYVLETEVYYHRDWPADRKR